MENLQGSICANLLLPPARERFEKLFAVAARKSIFAWHSSAHQQADVVLIDDSVLPQVLGHAPPCTVCLCKNSPVQPSASPWQARLSGDYTVADLIDLLDRAAVFLLDWQARPVAQRSAAVISPTAAAIAAPALYRLGTWASMGAPFDSPSCLRALALLSQRAVSAHQINAHSGLEPERTAALLTELQRRGVLLVSAATAPSGAPALRNKNATATAASSSLVQRLSRWLNYAAGQRA